MATRPMAHWLAVLAAALGYFVDLYDIVIFSVVRVESLKDLGMTGSDITTWGIRLFNLQMIGMLIGGIGWGLIADRWGRRFALIATITLYSLANIANAFIVDVEQYAVLRLVAGIGLAGELGAGIALITESLPKHRRGYGATIVAFLGLVGALAAAHIGPLMGWRAAYLLGGGMGLMVLSLRLIVLRDSAMFLQSHLDSTRQQLRALVQPMVLKRFALVIALGVPIWYASALFVTLAPEYGRALGFAQPLAVADVLHWQAIGLALGSALTGLASEWLRSRRRVLRFCYLALMVLTVALVFSPTPAIYCGLMFFMGLAQGYWTVFLIACAELFTTQVRGTAATAAPNVVRAMAVPVTLLLQWLAPAFGFVHATLLLGALVYGLSLWALNRVPETFGRDLQ